MSFVEDIRVVHALSLAVLPVDAFLGTPIPWPLDVRLGPHQPIRGRASDGSIRFVGLPPSALALDVSDPSGRYRQRGPRPIIAVPQTTADTDRVPLWPTSRAAYGGGITELRVRVSPLSPGSVTALELRVAPGALAPRHAGHPDSHGELVCPLTGVIEPDRGWISLRFEALDASGAPVAIDRVDAPSTAAGVPRVRAGASSRVTVHLR